MCPVGCHRICTGYGTQCNRVLVGTLITHHTYRADSREQYGTSLPNLIVERYLNLTILHISRNTGSQDAASFLTTQLHLVLTQATDIDLQDADDIYIRGLREYKVKLSGEEARRVLAAGVPADMQNGEIEVSLYDQIWQAGTVLLSTVRSVGVMGDERTYEHPVALRAVTSTDAMTADWAHLPYDFMAKVSNEIINKVKGVNRVCYDISSKPPSTIEWE